MTAAWLNLLHWPWILCDERIRRQQRNALHRGLRDQQAIERILVKWRQRGNRDSMRAGDEKLAIAAVEQSTSECKRIDVEIPAPQPGLYRHLPKTRGAKEQIV